ncbi:hypothetical protein C8034_v006116 [Colletotrichum sidae]|uniref:Uncharacterized protein n=1 Tax=Colletotrichum sidae TaxID=1347389 RepID=A0A4R8TSG6_9PEZI|nr:hypothetical protein C8034_v006116 [Colletotrichum sidae]
MATADSPALALSTAQAVRLGSAQSSPVNSNLASQSMKALAKYFAIKFFPIEPVAGPADLPGLPRNLYYVLHTAYKYCVALCLVSNISQTSQKHATPLGPGDKAFFDPVAGLVA